MWLDVGDTIEGTNATATVTSIRNAGFFESGLVVDVTTENERGLVFVGSPGVARPLLLPFFEEGFIAQSGPQEPSWSSDGQTIVFWLRRLFPDGDGGLVGTNGIWVGSRGTTAPVPAVSPLAIGLLSVLLVLAAYRMLWRRSERH